MSETKIVLPNVLLELSRQGSIAFRCNTGMAWVGNGKPVKITKPGSYKLNPGDVVLRCGRPLHAGLVKGGSDIIGWTPTVITPEMVGQTVAVFTAVECKDGKNQPTDDQVNFINAVLRDGGRAGVARNETDARDILQRPNYSP